MCRRYLRLLLLTIGALLLIAGGLPLFAFLHLDEPLQTAFIASKLLMLPIGAICLLGAAGLYVERH